VRIHLADDEHLLARTPGLRSPGGQSRADHFLGAAFAIHLGGIDQPVAEIKRQAHRGDLRRARARAGRRLAQAPGA
jgi:hypothetical protein